jgi:hypothetical protein
MGVPSMARPQPASGRQQARRGRGAASKATKAKPNPFDDIARQVNADQEAKDRAAGRDDLTPVSAKPVDQAKAKATTRQPAKRKPKQMKRDQAPTITLGHLWGDKKPVWLYRCTLVTRYEIRPDGTVWSTLDQVLGPNGKVLEDFWRLPLDFRPTQEVTGNGRKLVLKDRTIAGLQTWLVRAGLTTPEDNTTSTT